MSRFRVWIVKPPGDRHWMGFEIFARGLVWSLEQLGHDADIVAAPDVAKNDRRLIVINSHRLSALRTLPADAILFNAEQVPAAASLKWQSYLDRLSHHAVWDYSQANLKRLDHLGVTSTAHLAVGYWPGMGAWAGVESADRGKDIDVLFYGSLNTRRNAVLAEIGHKLHLKGLYGVYGEDLDDHVSRSRVVVNIHHYERPIWEVFRCAPLAARGVCIVSEDGGLDEELEDLARQVCVLTPYDKIAEACAELIGNEPARRLIGKHAVETFRARDQVSFVKHALEATL